MINFDERAAEIVRNYITEHLDKSDLEPDSSELEVSS